VTRNELQNEKWVTKYMTQKKRVIPLFNYKANTYTYTYAYTYAYTYTYASSSASSSASDSESDDS